MSTNISASTTTRGQEQKTGLQQFAALTCMGVLAGISLSPLYRVYSSLALVSAGMIGILLGILVAFGTATRRTGTAATLSISLSTAYVGAVLLRGLGSLTQGEQLGPHLLAEAAAGIVRVWKDMLTLEPRFGLESAMTLAPMLLAYLVTLGGGIWALRVRRTEFGVWAGVIPVLGYGVATLLGWRTAFISGRLSVVFALLLLVWAARWTGNLQPRRFLALAVMGAIMIGGGVYVSPLLIDPAARYVLRDELAPPFDPRDFPAPLSAYRTYLKDLKETELFTISGLPAGTPIRLAAMDDFDGVVWNVSGEGGPEGSGAFRRIGDQLQPDARGKTHELLVEVHEVPGPWLPTVGWLSELNFAASTATGQRGEVRYNDATGTAILPQGIPVGTKYRLKTVIPEAIDDEELTSARVGPVVLPEPQNVPDSVLTTASDATREASTPLAIARALEQYLQREGWFSNGQVTSGDYPSLAGHGTSRIISLFTSDIMVGNDEQYASAMALMGRAVGLPTRVVLGFIPEQSADAAVGEILDDVTVAGADVHAWVEIQFAGEGWVPFYPTPDESKTPQEDTPQDTHESQPQNLQPPIPPPDEVTPPDQDIERPQTEDTLDDDPGMGNLILWLAVGGGLLLLVLLLLAPALLIMGAKWLRRKRRRTAAHPVDRVTGGWDELVDYTLDLNGEATEPRRELTRSELSAELVQIAQEISDPARAPEVTSGVRSLARGADFAVFGPEEFTDSQASSYWGEVEQVRRGIRAGVSGKRRRRARWNRASLKYRRSERRAARKERAR